MILQNCNDFIAMDKLASNMATSINQQAEVISNQEGVSKKDATMTLFHSLKDKFMKKTTPAKESLWLAIKLKIRELEDDITSFQNSKKQKVSHNGFVDEDVGGENDLMEFLLTDKNNF